MRVRDAMGTTREGRRCEKRFIWRLTTVCMVLSSAEGVVDSNVVSRAGNIYAMGVLKHVDDASSRVER